jgi:hypothetical protein
MLIIAVLATASAAFLLFRYLRRQEDSVPIRKFIPENPPPNARPLFVPTDAELRQETATQTARSIARREYRSHTKSRAIVDEALSRWRNDPNGRSAAELLRVTAEHGLDGDFSRAAGEIVERSRVQGVSGLTPYDLAALLDSHLRILPATERGSGELFWLKEEIARLAAHD